jgi:hypothetical protein
MTHSASPAFRLALVAGACAVAIGRVLGAQSDANVLDKLLDGYVRDGYVYYAALKSDRAGLDRYVASLDVPATTLDAWSPDAKTAFWINAYDAIVLETVIAHYPIKGASHDYPVSSIRQIAGAFDEAKHRVAGQSLTLDEIEAAAERTGGARVVFALGRGAIGSGRLRSEVYTADRVEEQLADAAKEFVTRPTCLRLDPSSDTVEASPIFGWRADPITAGYADRADARFSARSPIERAIVALAWPFLYDRERGFLNTNSFRMSYGAFDWRLNDLTGGIPGGGQRR